MWGSTEQALVSAAAWTPVCGVFFATRGALGQLVYKLLVLMGKMAAIGGQWKSWVGARTASLRVSLPDAVAHVTFNRLNLF